MQRSDGSSQERGLASFVALAGLGLVGTLDFVIGHEVTFAVFYLAPLAVASWFGSQALAWTSCALATTLCYGPELAYAVLRPGVAVSWWPFIVWVTFFAVVTWLIRRLRVDLDERNHLIGQLQDSLEQVRTLRGLLPLCAWCRKVRHDDGYWSGVESYVEAHSEATFTHGICPTCEDELRGEEDLGARG